MTLRAGLGGALLVSLLVLMTGATVSAADGETVPDGATLYQTACASCHGADGSGGVGPTLIGVGAAAADFQLTTGRMPMANVDTQAVRKPPAFSDAEIAALVELVGSWGGPAIPDVAAARGDVAQGGVLYRDNCAACHSATGVGTSLSYGRYAPNLYQATPLQIAEAMRTGPGNMPVFAEDQLTPAEVDSIAAYIVELQRHDDPGGASLGRTGPIAEGMVGWLVGIAGLIGAAMWIEKRSA